MNRTLLITLFAMPLTIGCARVVTTSTPASASKSPNDNLTGAQRVQGAVPVLGRAFTQNDLNQLKIFMENARAESGSYPKSLNDMPGLQRDAPNIYKAIQSGDLVLTGQQSGVLAYEKKALDSQGSVLTTEGIQTMTAAELKQKLGR